MASQARGSGEYAASAFSFWCLEALKPLGRDLDPTIPLGTEFWSVLRQDLGAFFL